MGSEITTSATAFDDLLQRRHDFIRLAYKQPPTKYHAHCRVSASHASNKMEYSRATVTAELSNYGKLKIHDASLYELLHTPLHAASGVLCLSFCPQILTGADAFFPVLRLQSDRSFQFLHTVLGGLFPSDSVCTSFFTAYEMAGASPTVFTRQGCHVVFAARRALGFRVVRDGVACIHSYCIRTTHHNLELTHSLRSVNVISRTPLSLCTAEG